MLYALVSEQCLFRSSLHAFWYGDIRLLLKQNSYLEVVAHHAELCFQAQYLMSDVRPHAQCGFVGPKDKYLHCMRHVLQMI
jgi:hypothetical protein